MEKANAAYHFRVGVVPNPKVSGVRWMGERRDASEAWSVGALECYRTSNIQPPTSNIQHRTSNIELPTSNFQHRTSNVQRQSARAPTGAPEAGALPVFSSP